LDRFVGVSYPQEADTVQREFLPNWYFIMKFGEKVQISPDDLPNQVQLCVDASFEEFQSCKRWVGIGAGGGAVACAVLGRFSGWKAAGVCAAAVATGSNEAFLMCDREQRTREQLCQPANATETP
jgi:hypothetical protein